MIFTVCTNKWSPNTIFKSTNCFSEILISFSTKPHTNIELLVRQQDQMTHNPIIKEPTPVMFTVVSQGSWDHMIGHAIIWRVAVGGEMMAAGK